MLEGNTRYTQDESVIRSVGDINQNVIYGDYEPFLSPLRSAETFFDGETSTFQV
jgi:hypothetical protein